MLHIHSLYCVFHARTLRTRRISGRGFAAFHEFKRRRLLEYSVFDQSINASSLICKSTISSYHTPLLRPLIIGHQHTLSQLLFQSWRTSYNSLLTLFSVPNPTHTILLIYLLNGLAVPIEVLLPQYTSLALGWPLATVNRALALKALISAASLFALPTVR